MCALYMYVCMYVHGMYMYTFKFNVSLVHECFGYECDSPVEGTLLICTYMYSIGVCVCVCVC